MKKFEFIKVPASPSHKGTAARKSAAALAALTALLTATLLFFSACSSGPKRQMYITTISDSCKDSIETANSFILNGNYKRAEEV